jgi:TonB family protein
LILPDDKTKKAFRESKRDKMIGSFKLCIDEQGAIDRVSLLKSTGFAAYDAKIIAEMNAWAYRPYQVNGTAVPVCTAVTFIYSQK